MAELMQWLKQKWEILTSNRNKFQQAFMFNYLISNSSAMNKVIALSILLLYFSFSVNAQDGKALQQVKLVDMNDKPRNIPYMGEKMLFIVYLDPDVEGITDELTDTINKKGFSQAKLGALGVVNCKDTWIPDKAIITKARFMQKKYPESEILLDKSSTLKTNWSIGDCNNVAVIMIVGQDKKIKFIKKVKTKEEARIQISIIIRLLDSELK